MPKKSEEPSRSPRLRVESLEAWETWLRANHASSTGVWLELAKKDGGARAISYADALEGALCHGWIDGQKAALDAACWLQRFSPRTRRSPWSAINRAKVDALIAAGRMSAAGLREVEAAKADGRWEKAYAGSRTIAVPEDLEHALAASPAAKAFFEALDRANRYAILYRVGEAKKPETRARRIEKFVAMLARGERLHG